MQVAVSGQVHLQKREAGGRYFQGCCLSPDATTFSYRTVRQRGEHLLAFLGLQTSFSVAGSKQIFFFQEVAEELKAVATVFKVKLR